MTHICISKLTIIGSGNGLSPGRSQVIIWTNAGILLIRTLGTNFNILSEIHVFSFKKMHLKMSSAKWRPFCLGLNVLRVYNRNCEWNLWCYYLKNPTLSPFCICYDVGKTGNFNHNYSNVIFQKISIMSSKMWNGSLILPCWRHQMETFSALLALCAGNSSVTGVFPWQRPVTRSFDVFFDLHMNKRLSKKS